VAVVVVLLRGRLIVRLVQRHSHVGAIGARVSGSSTPPPECRRIPRDVLLDRYPVMVHHELLHRPGQTRPRPSHIPREQGSHSPRSTPGSLRQTLRLIHLRTKRASTGRPYILIPDNGITRRGLAVS